MTTKTVLVTGSARGIGRDTALFFAKNGYNVVINCISNKEKLSTLKSEIESFGTGCLAFAGDIGDYAFVRDMCQSVISEYGSIDILINNAGISSVGLFQDLSPYEWARILQTNLTGIYNTCHECIPHMIRNKLGSIINISSVWGVVGASCEVAYSATKGGINALTMALAKELAPSGIRVNAIAFGAIDTDMNSCFSAKELEALAAEIPAGRLGNSTEAAALIYDIAVSHPYLNGQIIKMDGAWI